MNTDSPTRLSLAMMIGTLLLAATVAVAQSSAGSTTAGARKEGPASAVAGSSESAGKGKAVGGTAPTVTGAGGAVRGERLTGASDGVAIRKIALEQSKYVKRQAKIDRLRALASKQGNEQRLAALDKLEAKLEDGHQRKMKRWRERLGDEKFGKIDKRLRGKRGKTMSGAPDTKRGGVDPDDGKGRAGDGTLSGSGQGKGRAGDGTLSGSDQGKARGGDGTLSGSDQGKARGGDGTLSGSGRGKGRDSGGSTAGGGAGDGDDKARDAKDAKKEKRGSGGGTLGGKKKSGGG